jgi:hypothetical protein
MFADDIDDDLLLNGDISKDLMLMDDDDCI